MPDLLTHVMSAYGLREATRARTLNYWFLFGTVLPDLLTRPLNIVFPSTYWVTMPLHTPLGLLFVCLALSLAFRDPRVVFVNLALGAGLHVFMDVFQSHIAGSYFLFFPFTWSSFEFDLMWPETTLYLLPLWLLFIVWIVRRRMREHRNRSLESRPLFPSYSQSR